MTDTFTAMTGFPEKGKLIQEAVYKIKETDTYARIECKDKDGRRAWSQVIPIDLKSF